MRKTAFARSETVAAEPTSIRLLLLLLALAALAVPRAGRAAPLLAAPVDLVTSGGVAFVRVETAQDRAVTVEWGAAPYATRVTRSPAGRHHAVALSGLEPGRAYVFRVRVGGVLVGPPRPFVMPGEPVPAPARALNL